MDLSIDNVLHITNATSLEIKQLQKITSLPNPAWKAACKFGRSTHGIPRIIKLYTNIDKHSIDIPRGSLYKMLNLLGPPAHTRDNTYLAEKQDIPSKIILRPLQVEWVNKMLMHRQGVGVAPAGSGKTIMTLEMLVQLGQPSLWLTHRKALVRQFVDRVHTFLGNIDVGIIGGGKFSIGDFLTVATIQTIARRNVEELKYKFAVVVIDEAHIVPAQQAAASIRKFAPHRLYGLTATPFREDALEQILFDTVGPIIVSMDRKEVIKQHNILPAIINIRDTNTSYPINKNIQVSYGKIIDFLIKNKDRNDMIVRDVLAEVALGNICIVLTGRIKHGVLLKEKLLSFNVPCVHVHSKMSDKKRIVAMDTFTSGQSPVMIATYQLLGDGFDYQAANRIFFTLPYKARSRIEQSKGRIERVLDNKSNAVVYDYVDNIPMLLKQFYIRMGYYHNHKLKIVRNKLI